MSDFILVRELSKRVLYNIGAQPSLIGKASLTNDFFLQEKTLDIDIGEQDVLRCPIWSSKTGSNTTCAICIVQNEIICVFCIDKNIFAFQFDENEENDSGSYFIKSEEKFVPMDMVQKLNFVSALEFMKREGLVWDKNNITDKLYKPLCELIEK